MEQEMIVYLLEYGRWMESGDCLGIFSDKEKLIETHPIFKLSNLEHDSCVWRDVWENDEYWIHVTTIKLDEWLPMDDKFVRDAVGFPEFYERTIE